MNVGLFDCQSHNCSLGSILISNCLLKSWKCSLCLLWRRCCIYDAAEHLKISTVWKTRSDPVSFQHLFEHRRPIKAHRIANGTSVEEFLRRQTVVFRGRNSHAMAEMIGLCCFLPRHISQLLMNFWHQFLERVSVALVTDLLSSPVQIQATRKQ